MKPTDKQVAANRANASKSTGPKSESGKKIACRNSLKHGLLAKEIVIDTGDGAENQDDFNRLLTDLHRHFNPQGTLEEMLVEKIVVAYWRLRRAHRYEVGLLRKDMDNAIVDFFEPDSFGLEPKNKSENEIEEEISQMQSGIKDWRAFKQRLRKMYKEGDDLDATYSDDFGDIWDVLHDKVSEEDSYVVEQDLLYEPKKLREYLNQRGWSDADIWQAHLDICDEYITSCYQSVRALEKDKQITRNALQIQMKLNSIPQGKELERLLKYEGTIEKQFYKAINQLERLQRLRHGDIVAAPLDIEVNVNDNIK